MPAGRPSLFSQELADLICERITQGRSLREICRADEMPNPDTVFAWLARNAEFSEQYARACRHRTDVWAEQIVDISEAAENAGGPVAVNAARLRVDTRKWLMARLSPKKYGDRVELAGDKDAPITVQVIRYADEQK